MGNATSQELSQQLSHPDHCYIETAPNRLLSHSTDKHDPKPAQLDSLAGKPVRFTRLAATRILQRLRAERLREDGDEHPRIVELSGETRILPPWWKEEYNKLPQPNERSAWEEVITQSQQHKEWYGCSYLWEVKGALGTVKMVYVLDPVNVAHIQDRKKNLTGYAYRDGKKQVILNREDVVCI